jgi:hypothetical protein
MGTLFSGHQLSDQTWNGRTSAHPRRGRRRRRRTRRGRTEKIRRRRGVGEGRRSGRRI